MSIFILLFYIFFEWKINDRYISNFQKIATLRPMQTIMYTNNKRQSSNYMSDRIVLAQTVDISQLIFNQREKYNLSNIHFWFVRENLVSLQDVNEEKILISVGNHIFSNKHSTMKIEYIAERFNVIKTQQNSTQNDINSESSSCISLNDQDIKPSALKKYKKKEYKKWQKEMLIKEQISFYNLKEFQKFIKKQIENNRDDEIIKKYIFQVNTGSIGISFISKENKTLLQNIVEEYNDTFYNERLNQTKIEAMHHKSYPIHKSQLRQPKQTYHKLIIYLLIDRHQQPVAKISKTMKIVKQRSQSKNISCLLSIQPWKLKEQIDILVKLQKEYELVKEEIENEKIMFRNKIKIIQNYIGDNINVERLYLQEEQLPQNNSQTANKKINQSMGGSFTQISQLTQLISTNDKFMRTQSNNLANISQFKRLKQLSDAIRGIDNIIYQQNIRKQSLVQKNKQLQKHKEELLYRNSKEINKVKANIVEIENEIKRKELQIQQKISSGEYVKLNQFKDKEPTSTASQNLQHHITFLTNHCNSLHEKHQIEIKQINKQKGISVNDQLGRSSSGSAYLRLKQKRNELALKGKNKQNSFIKQSTTNIIKSQASLMEDDSKNHLSYEQEIVKSKQTNILQKLQSQLMKLYQYFLKNDKLISSIKQEVSSYKFVKHLSTDKMRKKYKTGVGLIKHQNQFQFLQSGEPTFQMEQFPLLQKLLKQPNLQHKINQQHPSDMNKTAQIKQNNYQHKNCFQMMFCKGKKGQFSKQIEHSGQERSQKLTKCKKKFQMRQSIETVQILKDHIIQYKQPVSISKQTNKSPIKKKRTTIDANISQTFCSL